MKDAIIKWLLDGLKERGEVYRAQRFSDWQISKGAMYAELILAENYASIHTPRVKVYDNGSVRVTRLSSERGPIFSLADPDVIDKIVKVISDMRGMI